MGGREAESNAFAAMRNGGTDPAKVGSYQPAINHNSGPPIGPGMSMNAGFGAFDRPSPVSQLQKPPAIINGSSRFAMASDAGATTSNLPNISSGAPILAAIGESLIQDAGRLETAYLATVTSIVGSVPRSETANPEDSNTRLPPPSTIQVIASLQSRLIPLEIRCTPSIEKISNQEEVYIRIRFFGSNMIELDIPPLMSQINHAAQTRQKMIPQYSPSITAGLASDGSGRIKIFCTQRDPYGSDVSIIRVPMSDPSGELTSREVWTGRLAVGGFINIVDDLNGYPMTSPFTYSYRAIVKNISGDVGPTGFSEVVMCKSKHPAVPAEASQKDAECKIVAFNGKEQSVAILIDDVPDNAISMMLQRTRIGGSEGPTFVKVEKSCDPVKLRHTRKSTRDHALTTQIKNNRQFRKQNPFIYPLKQEETQTRAIKFIDFQFKDNARYRYTPIFLMEDRKSHVLSYSSSTVRAQKDARVEGFTFRHGSPSLNIPSNNIDRATVRFTCIPIVEETAQGLESAMSTLSRLGISQAYQDTVREERNRISDLCGIRVERIQHPEGITVDFGLVEGTEFSDDPSTRKVKNIPSLRRGKKYTYVLNLLVKPVGELFETTTFKQVRLDVGTGESIGQSIAVTPLIDFEKNTGQPSFLKDFLDGDVGVRSNNDIFIPYLKPRVVDVEISRGILDVLQVTWSIADGPMASVMHFEVYAIYDTTAGMVKMLRSTVTPLPSSTTNFQYNDDQMGTMLGLIRYRIRPVYLDNSFGVESPAQAAPIKTSDMTDWTINQLIETSVSNTPDQVGELLGAPESGGASQASSANIFTQFSSQGSPPWANN